MAVEQLSLRFRKYDTSDAIRDAVAHGLRFAREHGLKEDDWCGPGDPDCPASYTPVLVDVETGEYL